MTPLVLASTSVWRRAQLEQLGLAFDTAEPGVDEGEWKARIRDVATLAQALARAKAEAVSATRDDAIVIAGDQIAEVDGRRLDKPGSDDAAVGQLRMLRGRTHRLVTSLCVLAPGGALACDAVVVTRLTMRHWSDEELEAYVASEDVTSCAGSYRIEARGAALFERSDGPDPTAIVGLPLMALSGALRELGVPLFAPRRR